MIIVKSRGQLGNQMFQLAFALATSHKLRTCFYLHKIDLPPSLHYFRLTISCGVSHESISLAFFKMMQPLMRWYNHLIRILKVIFISHDIELNEWQDASAQLESFSDNTYYRGFFQSRDYIIKMENQVREMYSVRKKYKQHYDTKYGNLNEKYAVVQVRRNDYLDSGSELLGGDDLTLPDKYFVQGLRHLQQSSDIKRVFIISDDTSYCVNLFAQLPKVEISIEQNTAIVDFQLMLHATALLISPSSFAWWAAYLNEIPNKVIYCPEFWLGHKVQKEFPVGIIPQGWKKINYHNADA